MHVFFKEFLSSIIFGALELSSNKCPHGQGEGSLLSKKRAGMNRGREGVSKMARMCRHPLWVTPYLNRTIKVYVFCGPVVNDPLDRGMGTLAVGNAFYVLFCIIS